MYQHKPFYKNLSNDWLRKQRIDKYENQFLLVILKRVICLQQLWVEQTKISGSPSEFWS